MNALTRDISEISPEVAGDATALLVQVEAGQGFARPYNTEPANLLVVVTDPRTGVAVTGLREEHFTVINHFSIPGQACGFSNTIVFFNDVMTGAYHIQVGLTDDVPGCTWVWGDYLLQVIVAAGQRSGQGTATLRIR